MEHAFLQELHAAVKARLDTVADHPFRDRDPSAHLAALKTAAARLDTLASNLPAGADPELRHYLERQSYTKALAWLESATGRA
jgi:plasmid stabilization system protein ParE